MTARGDISVLGGERVINMQRTCAILGVGWETASRLARAGHIELVEHRGRAWKLIRYQSLVRFCNRMRDEYHVLDRRPPLASSEIEYRDEDLLPFPLADTIYSEEVIVALGVSKNVLSHLIDERRFEAYRLAFPRGRATKGSPWRISRSSFREYLIEVKLLPREEEEDRGSNFERPQARLPA